MKEYIANRARLGWLLDPVAKQVHIYRPKAKPEIIEAPSEIFDNPVLPNFRLDVPKIWAAMNRRR